VSRRIDFIFLSPKERSRNAVHASRLILNQPARLADGTVLWPSDYYGLFNPTSRVPLVCEGDTSSSDIGSLIGERVQLVFQAVGQHSLDFLLPRGLVKPPIIEQFARALMPSSSIFVIERHGASAPE
jgi:hypothetical protein